MIRDFGRLFACERSPCRPLLLYRGRSGRRYSAPGAPVIWYWAAASASFGQPEIKLVSSPVAAALFPRLIGYQQAARLLFSGEVIMAAEAAQLGMVTYTVADEELAEKLEQLLTQAARIERGSVAHDQARADLWR